jgi:hypothetical protein
MPVQKSNKIKKTPLSQMIRVPTALIPYVKELSQLHRQGHTTAIQKGLQSLISAIDSDFDSDIGSDSETVKQLVLRLEKLESRQCDGDAPSKSVEHLEQRLEAMATKLAQLEAVLVQMQRYRNTSRRQGFPYNNHGSTEVQLQSYTQENLAKRLGVDAASLTHIRTSRSPGDFERWCRSRDPSGLGWRLNESDGMYNPVK